MNEENQMNAAEQIPCPYRQLLLEKQSAEDRIPSLVSQMGLPHYLAANE